MILLLLAAAASPAPAFPPAKPEELVRARDAMRCVASAAPLQSAKVLDDMSGDDPTTWAAMNKLLNTNKRCFGFDTMRARGVVVPGFLAEAQLRKVAGDRATQAVAYRADAPTIKARNEAEGIALCTVRLKPTETWAVFATSPGSAEEKAALAPLVPTLGECTPATAQAKFNRPGLRAMLALAYRRLVLFSGAKL